MWIVKEYGSGDNGKYCNVFLFQSKDLADRMLDYILITQVLEDENAADKEDREYMRKLFNTGKKFEWEQDDRYMSVVYIPGEYLGVIDDNAGYDTLVEIENKDFINKIPIG